MTIDNFCEFIKKIYTDPLAEVNDMSIKDFLALKEHVQSCEKCAILVDEVVERYKNVPEDPNLNDGRFN